MSGEGIVIQSQGKPIPPGANEAAPAGTAPLRASKASPERNRRTFTAEYKLRILLRAREQRAMGRGRLQAMLRQEGLCTSHLAEWKKQLQQGRLGKGQRGRPEKSQQTLQVEIRRLKHRLASLEKKCLHAENLLMLQRKYVLAASLKLERKDRGLLSTLISQVENASSITAACRALGLSRPDFYRTIKPLRKPHPPFRPS